jgi:phosphosulfolactate phosphohydrolase-like enzyme
LVTKTKYTTSPLHVETIEGTNVVFTTNNTTLAKAALKFGSEAWVLKKREE